MSTPARRASVDLARALARFGDNARILRQAAASFLELAPDSSVKLRQAIERRDRVAVEFAAHRFRGQASTFDAFELVDAIRAIESLSEAHARGESADIWTQADEAVSRVERALVDVICELRRAAEDPSK
jgi:HPt (histidine-containing phosphotransfer) domain-containing protein